MKDVFSPIFLITLLLLFVFLHLNVFFEIIQPFVFTFFIISLILFVLSKYKLSYIFITISIALLIVFIFLKGKNDFILKKETQIDENQYISIRGKPKDFPEIKRDHSILYIQSESLEYNQRKIFNTFNIRIKVKGNLQNLYMGDTININARIYKNRFSQNFYPNPFENYVLSKKIHFNGYCKSDQLITVEKKTNFLLRTIGRWRNKIRETIEKKFTERDGKLNKKGVFLEAILIGDRGKLSNEQKEELLSSGVYHLLAISGAHIGIIAVFSLILLKFFRISFKKRYIITSLIILIFLILSGFKISAQRAVLMAILIFIAKILYYEINIFNIISFSGLLILIKNPAEFLDAGFILTYSLTAAIVMGRKIFAPLLQKYFTYLREFLSANISASLISLPLSLFFFKRYSFACFFSGLVLLPLTAIVTGLGILLIPMAPISTKISHIFLTITDVVMDLFFKTVIFFSDVMILNIHRSSPSIFLVVLILFVFYLMTKKYKKILKIPVVVIFFILMSFIAIKKSHYSPENLEVFYLDVGQGESEIIVFPKGDSLLIDGGGTYFTDFEIGKQIVLPFILQKRIKITWIAVSHYHPDHSKGIIEIMNVLKPRELWLSSEAKKDFFYQTLVTSLNPSIELKKLDSSFFKSVGTCSIEFLFPEKFIVADHSENNHSQVIKVSNNFHSFLFTGDIEKKIENLLVQNDCSKLETDVLKAPHHGSESSSTAPFLKCIGPKIVVFSYAFNNRFKFPHKEAIKNYKNQNTKMLSTANRGGIKITSTLNALKIETSK